ncbi:MAG: hypothetical protein ACP5QR_10725 [Rhizomicrobium sp.]
MEREWLLLMLIMLLGGVALHSVAWLPSKPSDSTSGRAQEQRAWLRLWYPVVPALLIAAWLGGWALTQFDPVRDRLGIWTLYGLWLPFAFIFGRAVVRAAWALLRSTPDSGVSTIGLFRPQTLFSPFLAKQLDEQLICAALAHEHAHARHRDPLRIWLAQLVTDLQWPWPPAQQRFISWLVALELARDDEARELGADGADLAAAVMASIRFARQLPVKEPALSSGTLFAHAHLFGDGRVLRERVTRLLAPLCQVEQLAEDPTLSFQSAALLLVPALLLAAFAGAWFGPPVLQALLALTA